MVSIGGPYFSCQTQIQSWLTLQNKYQILAQRLRSLRGRCFLLFAVVVLEKNSLAGTPTSSGEIF